MTAEESSASDGRRAPEAEASTPGDPVATDTAEPDAPAGESARHAKPAKKSFWRELPFLILIALVLALLIKTFLVQAFYIPSASMENTLQGGPNGSDTAHHPYDRVLVNKLVYRFRPVHRGEIVVFKGPSSWQSEFTPSTPSNPIGRFFHDIGSALGVAAPSAKDFVKRVVGVGGDHVVCCDAQGRITVNSVPLNESSYLYPGAKPSMQPFDVTVPKGRLWVMGDNRAGSADSRSHMDDNNGTIPQSDVIGRAFVVVWPPSDWKTLPVPKTFHQKGLAALAGDAAPLALSAAAVTPVALVRRRRRRTRRRVAA